jgi:AraC-like DNA-binding protein
MGDLFIAYPNEVHSTGPKRNTENQHLWLCVCLDKLGPDGVQLAHELRRRKIHLLSECQEAEALLQAIIGQVVELRPRRSLVIAALLHAFVAFLLQRISLAASDDIRPRKPLLPYSFAVQKAISYMRQNLDRRIPLSDLAALTTLRNIPHFCTQFRREVGVSPSRHHLQLRLDSARTMLRQPDTDITSTALQCGFSSSQHFGTLFRRNFGITPFQWKKGLPPGRHPRRRRA